MSPVVPIAALIAPGVNLPVLKLPEAMFRVTWATAEKLAKIVSEKLNCNILLSFPDVISVHKYDKILQRTLVVIINAGININTCMNVFTG